MLTLLLTFALAAEPVRPLDALVATLAATKDADAQRDILRGMAEALAGRRNMKPPTGWGAVRASLAESPDPEVREKVIALAVLFGDKAALDGLRKLLTDPRADAGRRSQAIELLLDKQADGLGATLLMLLDDKAVRLAAIKGLARYDAAAIPTKLLALYGSLTADEKVAAVGTLASRPAFAVQLLAALDAKKIAREDVSPFAARQMASLGDKAVEAKLLAVWGSVRPANKERAELLARYKKLAADTDLKRADRSLGRAVWAKNCAACHTVFGEGAKIGPDLTGSQRANPEYILGKILDPSAVVPREYLVTRVELKRGRVITGLVKSENDKLVELQTPTEVVRVQKSDIAGREQLKASLMPEGLLNVLKDAEVVALLAYLGGKDQVALPRE